MRRPRHPWTIMRDNRKEQAWREMRDLVNTGVCPTLSDLKKVRNKVMGKMAKEWK